jgi:large subunit ribosomal protein L24
VTGQQSGGLVHQEALIDVSNVMYAVEVDGKKVGTRIGYRVNEDGDKVRYAKRTGEDI